LFDDCGAAAAELFGPGDASPAAVVDLALPGAEVFELGLFALDCGEIGLPVGAQVIGEPLTEAVAEGEFGRGKIEIQRRAETIVSPRRSI
jgi:hypothetical protein